MNEENKRLEENIKKHIDVVLEDVKEKFDILAEGQGVIMDRLEGLERGQEAIKGDVELLKEDMDYVKSEIVEIKERFRETDKALAEKADKDVAINHETRIIRLESSALAEA